MLNLNTKLLYILDAILNVIVINEHKDMHKHGRRPRTPWEQSSWTSHSHNIPHLQFLANDATHILLLRLFLQENKARVVSLNSWTTEEGQEATVEWKVISPFFKIFQCSLVQAICVNRQGNVLYASNIGIHALSLRANGNLIKITINTNIQLIKT